MNALTKHYNALSEHPISALTGITNMRHFAWELKNSWSGERVSM